MSAVTFTVNGRIVTLDADGADTLLTVLRDRLGLTGTKEGCAEGECGACTVLVDGVPVDSCILNVHAVAGSDVLTIEGLATTDGRLSPIQQAFIDNFSVQCGFCTPGFLMTLTALIADTPTPDELTIRSAVSGNLCRCTGYSTIVDAVMAATGQTERS
jgi:carbon-monoxide dehydrogenase small subunit